ncbi:MAG TPA: cation transporter [Sandaracinaceae bacterium]
MTTHELKIEGMTCGHCVRAVERALAAVPGVKKAEVAIGTAKVEADAQVARSALVAAIEDEGYRVTG